MDFVPFFQPPFIQISLIFYEGGRPCCTTIYTQGMSVCVWGVFEVWLLGVFLHMCECMYGGVYFVL